MSTTVPTFAVVASINRPHLLAQLYAQLEPQVEAVFTYDNGYVPACPVAAIEAHGWPLHRMWNHGLQLAAIAAGGKPHNVAILNDDVTIGPTFLATLAAGLRSRPNIAIASPPCTDTASGRDTLAGWAFLLRGEDGYRLDEGFEWECGDDDLRLLIEAGGKHVCIVEGTGAIHHHPDANTKASPELTAAASRDRRRLESKWSASATTRAPYRLVPLETQARSAANQLAEADPWRGRLVDILSVGR